MERPADLGSLGGAEVEGVLREIAGMGLQECLQVHLAAFGRSVRLQQLLSHVSMAFG